MSFPADRYQHERRIARPHDLKRVLHFIISLPQHNTVINDSGRAKSGGKIQNRSFGLEPILGHVEIEGLKDWNFENPTSFLHFIFEVKSQQLLSAYHLLSAFLVTNFPAPAQL